MPRFGDLLDLVGFLPAWASTLVVVLALTWTVCMAGLILRKTGRNPFWAVAPFVFAPLFTVGLWWLALGRWPRQEGDPP